jgi:hypothetical protein
MKSTKNYKEEFLAQLYSSGLKPLFVPEYPFMHSRNWRFDWACHKLQIAVEYQGGTGKSRMGHTSYKGQTNDNHKFSEAPIRGWMIILINAEMVEDGSALHYVNLAVKTRLTKATFRKKGQNYARKEEG